MKNVFNFTRALCASLLLFALPLAASTLDPSGDLDTSFATGGKASFNFATVIVPADSRAAILQPNGKVVIGGGSNNGLFKDYILVRLNTDGTTDTSFGTGGVTTVDMGFDDHINGMAQNSNGSRFCGGGISSVEFGVACFTTNGALDTTFNATGISKSNAPGSGGGGRILGMTFDRSDRLVAIGYGAAGPGGRDMFLRRYNTNGTPDTSFGTNSWVQIDVGGGMERGFDVAVIKGASVAQDQLVAVGTNQSKLVIALLNANGALDTSSHTLTGTSGIYSPASAPLGVTILEGVAIDSSGNIFVTGQGPTAGFHVLKYSLSSAAALASTGNLGTTSNDVGFRVRIDSTNRVYASGTAGDGSNFAVARMSNDLATVDYHTNTDFGGSDFAQDLVIEANGFVTAVGGGGTGVNSIDAARYKTDGTLDTNFATNGLYHAAIMGGSTDESRAFGVQSDGKMVVAGTTLNSVGDYDILVTRINTDGTRDSANWAAGTGGWDTRGFAMGSADNVSPNGVAIDSNGKAVVVGATSGTGFTDFFALRYNSNGTLDTGFGGGIVRNNWGTNSVGTAVAIDASNNVIVGGDITLNGDFTFARLKAADGSLDTSFNGTGKQTVDIATGKSDVLKALAVDPSGRILAAGQCIVHVGTTDVFKMCLARLNSNGSLDTTFDGDGKVLLNISGSDSFDIRSIQLLSDLDTASTTDYKIVIGGQFVQSSPSQSMWLVARLNMDGSLDTSFNGSGYKTLVPGTAGYVGAANSVALQYDEKIVVFGESSAPDPQNPGFFLFRQITVARMNWDGSLDTTYGDNGFRYATQSSDPGEAYQGFIYPQTNASLKGRAVATSFIIAGDFAFTRYREDPAPIAGANAPDLSAASDTGRSSTDNITKDTTPTFTGTCSQGETVYLLINTANTTPRTRQICPAAGTYSLTSPALSGVPRTTYSITTQTQSGIGDSAVSAALSVTIDAEINPTIAITNPVAASNQSLNPTINGTSAESTADIVITSTGAGTGCASFQAAADGTWSCTSGLTQGAQTISVVQTDVAGNVAGAVTRSFSVKAATTTTLVSNANPSKFGQPLTFTATVAPNGPHNLSVTGTTVRFLIDGSQVSAPALDGAGQATFSPTGLGLSVGTHTVQAVYDENANWLASSGSVTPDQVVQKTDTTTSVSSSANPSVFGQSVTFTATVATVAPGAGTPTGTVTFLDGGSPIGTGALSGGGVATFTTSTLIATSHTITTTYAGDGNHNGSAGSLISNPQVVNKANTATAVTASQNPSTLNQSVTFTATITASAPGAGTPTGTVTFLDGGSSIGTGTLSGGVATFSTSALTVGNHTITTTYAGDGNFNGGAGSLAGNPQVVKKLPTATSLTSSQNPAKFGQSVTFTATVAVTPPGTGTPTGTVTFLDGGSSIGTGTLDGSGVASFTSSTLATGNHTMTASYGADATFDISTGALTGNPQVINKADTTTTLNSAVNPSVFGQSVTFTATIAATAPGAGAPSGTVTFLDGGSSIGTGTLSAGVATFASSTLAVGNHAITTTYAGDANFNASAGSLIGNPQVVNKADVATTLTSLQNPSLPGQSVTFTATITAAAPGVGSPTGAVTFLDAGNPIGSGPLSSGVATFATSSLTPGNHTITSSYSGDGNFNIGTGSLTGNPQVVSKLATSTTIDSVTPAGPITLGSSVSVTASVAAAPPGSGTPTGTIAVNDGGVGAGDLCTITLPSNSCTLTPSNTGNHVIFANYNGDGTFLGSTSGGTTFSVTPPTRTITASAGSNGGITPASQYVVDGNTASFTVTPDSGYSAVMSTDCPEGLGTMSNNLYTTRAISADCTVTATFAPASASLTLVVTDNREYARYGELANFVVTISNSGGTTVTGLSISGNDTSPSSDLNTVAGHWLCFGSGTQCAPSGNGPFNDANVSVPANGSVSWLVTVPVLTDAPDMAVSYTVTLSGAGADVIQSDTDTLTIYRDGFDVAYGDGTQIALPIIWDGNSALAFSLSATNSGTIESLLNANTLDKSGFRIEQVDADQQIWIRAIAIDVHGNEQATAWTRVVPTAQLLLSSVTAQKGRVLIVVGPENEIDCAIAAATSWQVQKSGD